MDLPSDVTEQHMHIIHRQFNETVPKLLSIVDRKESRMETVYERD